MMDADTRRFIQNEIRRQINLITSGESGTNTIESEDIQNCYPGMATIEARPVMHPYGFVSRAAKGTIQVTAQQGDHPGNKMVLGHRDKDRPDLEEGESKVYSLGQYQVHIKNDSIKFGKGTTFETAVVGETLAQLLSQMLDAIVAHKHTTTSPGTLTTPPDNASTFTSLKSDFVSNEKILAKNGGRF